MPGKKTEFAGDGRLGGKKAKRPEEAWGLGLEWTSVTISNYR